MPAGLTRHNILLLACLLVQALRVARLDKHTPSADVKQLQAVLSAGGLECSVVLHGS